MPKPIKIKPLLEEDIQEAVVAWMDSKGIIFTHIPSGGKRSKGYAAKLKRQGLKPGWPDLMVMLDDGFGCLELKRPKKGRIEPEQQAFADECQRRGIKHAFAYGYSEAIEILKQWLHITPP